MSKATDIFDAIRLIAWLAKCETPQYLVPVGDGTCIDMTALMRVYDGLSEEDQQKVRDLP